MIATHTCINEGQFYRDRTEHLRRYDELRLWLYAERERLRYALLTKDPGRNEKRWLITEIRAIDYTLLNFGNFTETLCGTLH